MGQRICSNCQKRFEVNPKNPRQKYCTHKCFWEWRREFYKPSVATKKRISKSLIGNKYRVGHKPWITGKVNIWALAEKNINWKGDEVGYRALHRWIRSRKKGGNICEFCGRLKTTPKSIHLANKSHKYLRQLDDWFWLCAKCHKKYDHK